MAKQLIAKKMTLKAPTESLAGLVFGSLKNNPLSAIDESVDDRLLNTVLNILPEPIFVKDIKHRWIILNDAYCKFMGHSRESLLGKSDKDFFPKKEAAVFWEKDEEVFRTKKQNVNQENFTDAKGITHAIITKKNYYVDKSGAQFLVGIISDITERTKLEKLLLEQKQEQEMLLDEIPALIFYKDVNNNCLKVNKAFAKAMGKKKEELEGQPLTKIYPKAKAEAFWLDDQEVIKSGKPKYNIIESFKTPTGNMWVQTAKIPHRDDRDKVIGIIGFAVDITEKKEAEDTLHLTADRLGLATRVAGVGIWDYDIINNKLLWDDQMYRLYGIKPEKFSGAYEAWRSGLHPDDAKRGDAEIQMAIRGEKEFNTEFRVLWPNKTVRYIRAIALVERDQSGKALRMVGTNWDITESKKTDETLKEKITELERLNKLMIGRELKMVDLKNTIERLKNQSVKK